MKYAFALVALLSTSAFAQGSHAVRGHYRSDGTYVQPHMQTNPNETKLDNWSTRGNTNPYTGREGTIDPYRPTERNPSGSPYNQTRRNSSSY